MTGPDDGSRFSRGVSLGLAAGGLLVAGALLLLCLVLRAKFAG